MAKQQSRSTTSTSVTRSGTGSRMQNRSGILSGGASTDLWEGDDLSDREEVASSSRILPPSPTPLLPKYNTNGTDEELRQGIRDELINLVGGSMEAFRTMDLCNSGKICLQEFSDGMDRIGVPWQQITGFRWILDLFALFDHDPRNGIVTLEELFPPETREIVEKRPNTPEFWDNWCDWSDRYTERTHDDRNPHWDAKAPSVELNRLFKAKKTCEEAAKHRRWMSSMFRRLKNKGKSDAQSRECIALHLPRGTGPNDRTSVATFSEQNVKNCKRTYQEGVQTHVRTIQKEVYSMREQRQHLTETRQSLYTITGPLLAAQRFEEDKKAAVAGFAGMGCGAGLMNTRHIKEDDFDAEGRPGTADSVCVTVATPLGSVYRKASIAPVG